METIAVYSEQPIKTYGIGVETGLCLLSAVVDTARMAVLNRSSFSPASLTGRLMMVSATPVDGGRLLVHCVTSAPPPMPAEAESAQWPMAVVCGVELVFFHGPHYGDRYGIAAAAFDALAAKSVPVLSAACSGASVYVVVPQGRAADASAALQTAFVVPSPEAGQTT
ncbi:MAG: hypothetical protein ABIL58_07655 [Pseudomonadota bacterium]